jgi:adenylosuccinate synthase
MVKRMARQSISEAPRVIRHSQVTALVGDQKGDEGKAKIVQTLLPFVEYDERCNAGGNRGGTAIYRGEKFVFHLIPAGILDPEVTPVITEGVEINPGIIDELKALEKRGIDTRKLKISHNARVVLPYDIMMDALGERGRRVGTTKQGMGFAHASDTMGLDVRVQDLLNPPQLRRRINEYLELWMPILEQLPKPELAQLLAELHGGRYSGLDREPVIAAYTELGKQLASFVTNTRDLNALAIRRGERILLEGGNGLFLSKQYGTRGAKTSCETSYIGCAQGAGIDPKLVKSVGLAKAFYMTRVGGGPLVTEFGGTRSEKWCSEKGPDGRALHTRESEKKEYGHLSVNEPDPFHKGIAIRLAGDEYGATTGRPRRTGRLDLPMLQQAVRINGPNLVLTLVDVLDKARSIELCTGYTYEGEPVNHEGRMLQPGDQIEFTEQSEVLRHVHPVYETFPGWHSPTGSIRRYGDLPRQMRTLVRKVEEHTGGHVIGISNGPAPEQMIWR